MAGQLVTDQPRDPKGAPTGGRYGHVRRPEPRPIELTVPVRVPVARGEDIELTPGVINDQAEWAYRNGQCLALAAAVAKKRGWPVVLHLDEDGAVRHAYAQALDGTLLDVYGENDPEALELDEGEKLEVLDPDDAVEEYQDVLPRQDHQTAATFVDLVLAKYTPPAPPRRLDPAVAHMIDSRTLLNLMPHTDQMHLSDVRLELARHISARAARVPFQTWQDAWNDMTADGRRPIRLSSATCPQCRGKRYSTRNVARNLSRTGHAAVCGECGGRGRTTVTVQTKAAAPPA